MQKKNWRKNHKKKKSIIKFHICITRWSWMHGKYFIAALNWDFNYLCLSATVHSLFIFEWLLFTWSGYTQRALELWFPGIRNEVIAMLRTWNYVLCSRFKMAFIYKQKKDVRMAKKRIITKHCSKNTIFVLAAATVAVCDVVIWNSIYYDKKCIETRNETNFEWIAI